MGDCPLCVILGRGEWPNALKRMIPFMVSKNINGTTTFLGFWKN